MKTPSGREEDSVSATRRLAHACSSQLLSAHATVTPSSSPHCAHRRAREAQRRLMKPAKERERRITRTHTRAPAMRSTAHTSAAQHC